MSKSVLVLDFGSQYTQLIARRIRELNIFSEVRPCTDRRDSVDLARFGAIIFSGGPASVTDSSAPEFDSAWLKTGLPTLGICYGMQLLAHALGGDLASGRKREYGQANITLQSTEDLFAGFGDGASLGVWMSHGDHVHSLPSGFKVLAQSESCPIAAMGDSSRKMYGIQFHPEVVHTFRGKEIIANFLTKIAAVPQDWTPAGFIETSIAEIRAAVPTGANVICGISGGVDSTVAAVLVHKAIGDRLHCIFVDNGLLRKDESNQVMDSLGPNGLGLNIHLADSAKLFLGALKGVSDPEKKRKIIGHVFIDVFEAEANRIANVSHLVQGTLYPDVIESVSVKGPSATIKTHHNVGGLPSNLKFKLIEPFRELFKDEVRAIGRELIVPEYFVARQPFPGPGLAVRIIGEVTEDRLALLREADYIFNDEISKAGVKGLWQSFAVLLPVQSVGVMGDGRTYEWTVALRAVTSEDGMTADWAALPADVLKRASSRITNEVRGINRVVFDISSKPPATIEWE